jgi:GNAT superfamily N-acetyltransferase
MLAGGDKLPPAVVRRNGIGWHVVDGNHRLEAALKRGLKEMDAYELVDPPKKTKKSEESLEKGEFRAAGFKHKDGTVVETGAFHNIDPWLLGGPMNHRNDGPWNSSDWEAGFVTHGGVFMNRDEAAKHVGLRAYSPVTGKLRNLDSQDPESGLKKADDDLVAATTESLDDSLRKPQYRGNPNELAGHCYVSCEALFHMMGGHESGWVPQNVKHEGDQHWYLRHSKTGEILDPTASQFRTPVPYHQGRGRGFLTKQPSKRAQEVINRVQAKLGKAEDLAKAAAPGDPSYQKNWIVHHEADHGAYQISAGLHNRLQAQQVVNLHYTSKKNGKPVHLGVFNDKHQAKQAMLEHHDKVAAGLIKKDPVDTSFDFGANDPTQDPLHQKALRSIARMHPENQKVAHAWIAFTRGHTDQRPVIHPDLERHLARFGIVDPKGYPYQENGRSMERSVGGKRASGRKGPRQAEPEGLRRYRALDRDYFMPYQRSEVVGDEDLLQKGFLSTAALAGSLALGQVGGAEPNPKPAKALVEATQRVGIPAEPVKWSALGLHQALIPIAHLESSFGQNIAHAKHPKGDYHTAHGALGFKPVTAHEEYLRAPTLQKLYGDMKDPAVFLNKFKTDPKFYNLLATSHFMRLQKQHGSPERAAYAWRWGTGACQGASDEQVATEPYVMRYRSLAANAGLKKMAIKDIKPGTPIDDTTYDYTHLIKSPVIRRKYSIHVTHDPTAGQKPMDPNAREPRSIARVTLKSNASGALVGYIDASWDRTEAGHKAILPTYSVIRDKSLRGKGIGKAMYEALYAHAHNHLGIKHAVGEDHSTSASKVHQALADKHGWDYQPQWGDRDQVVSRDFDGAFGPYEYKLT